MVDLFLNDGVRHAVGKSTDDQQGDKADPDQVDNKLPGNTDPDFSAVVVVHRLISPRFEKTYFKEDAVTGSTST
jgi:hypothetical protein